MFVSLEWLRAIADISVSDDDIIENIPANGLEIETVKKTGVGEQNVVVCEILEKSAHPESKDLFVTQVDAGSFGKKQIVTNLVQVKVGDKLLVALENAVLTGDFTIKLAKVRNVESQGMFVGWENLGFNIKSPDPIFVDSDMKSGALYHEILPFNDSVIDVELTANRGDCLGMKGIVTDIAARFESKIADFDTSYKTSSKNTSDFIDVTVTTANCPRYAGAIIENVIIKPSPMWMQLRLAKAGIRPISNVVDITNYILLEMNQPLHAFDYDNLAGSGKKSLNIRDAVNGEKIVTLDGNERELKVGDIVIADAEKSQCIGGIMGGEFSEVTANTKTIFLESAFFAPVNIRKTSRRLGLRSEASYRFEREIDMKNVDFALQRALYYFDMLGVGTISQGIVDVYPKKYEDKVVKTSVSWINGKLGTEISFEQMQAILKRLRFEVVLSADGDELSLTVPSNRNDISIREDIAEEVARIYGYNNIKATYFAPKQAGTRTILQKKVKKLHQLLVSSGLSEAMNFSFVGKSLFDKMELSEDHAMRNAVMLEVPLTDDWAGMRTSLLPGMLRTVSFNTTRQNKNLALFEIGNISIPSSELLPVEKKNICIALSGRRDEKSYCSTDLNYDFYDLKGVLDAISENFRVNLEYKASNESFFHPYQQAEIFIDGKSAGMIGKLHPSIADNFDIDVDCFIAELNTNLLFENSFDAIIFKEVPKFPSSERDIAVIFNESVTAYQIQKTIEDCKIDILCGISFFDIYAGDHIEKGHYSMAIKLQFNKIVSTLKDSEVEEATNIVLKALEEKLNGKLR